MGILREVRADARAEPPQHRRGHHHLATAPASADPPLAPPPMSRHSPRAALFATAVRGTFGLVQLQEQTIFSNLK